MLSLICKLLQASCKEFEAQASNAASEVLCVKEQLSKALEDAALVKNECGRLQDGVEQLKEQLCEAQVSGRGGFILL